MDSDLELSDNDNADDDADDDSDFDATQEETNAAVADDSSADEEDNVDDAVVAGANKRRCLWKIGGNFTPNIFPYVENQHHHVDFSTINYFDQYIDMELLETMAFASNVMYITAHGEQSPLSTSAQELRRFIGITLMMGCIRMPRIRMYWANKTRVNVIANAMPRDRFFLPRNNLKCVIDFNVDDIVKQQDKLWKIRPYTERIRQGCLRVARPRDVCIDEQMIPFTGKSQLRQFVRGKPNPTGLKNFIVASPEGLVLDFEIFQGKAALPDVADVEKRKAGERLGIGGLTVMRVSDSLTSGNILYFDRYFTNLACMQELMKIGILATGTVMKRYLPKDCKLPATVAGPRGSYVLSTRADEELCCVLWMDNKPVMLMSTAQALDPVSECRRWSKKDNVHIQVPRPALIGSYSDKMGGVDLCDRMLAHYRAAAKSRKWTVRCIIHFFDVVAVNCWIQWRKDAVLRGEMRKYKLEMLAFRIQMAEELLSDDPDGSDADGDVPRNARRMQRMAAADL